ncbi:MAG: SAM-dependent chlorinase/fluorinase [Bdellovibrionales bacterium]|nr:SAM-dependent chlorinase/fluorinase [Bdellovibrionales bacterium]
MSIVSLTTDFGTTDPYVGMMKAVILTYDPSCVLVDLTHGISPQDINAAQFFLSHAWTFFPKKTIHLVVVDPGVGTSRSRIVATQDSHWFVGPDNGVFSFLDMERAKIWRVPSLEDIPKKSVTFEGRDVFSHIVGKLIQGLPVGDFGIPVNQIGLSKLPSVQSQDGVVKGSVLFFDHFGNVITNIPGEVLKNFTKPKILISEYSIESIESTYEHHRGAIAIINSYNLLEIAVPKGSAKDRLKVAPGAEVVVKES